MHQKIVSTKDIAANRFTCLVYGVAGIGKTSLAKNLPGKTLIVSAESGLLSLKGTDIDVWPVKNWLDLSEMTRFLQTKPAQEKYKFIFIDSLTELGERLIEHLKPNYNAKQTMKLWGEYSDRMTLFVKSFRDFEPYNVIFTALEKVKTDENNVRHIELDLYGKIADKLPAYLDEFFRMVKVTQKDGNSFRLLQTEIMNNAVAKDRSGSLKRPYEIADLGYVYNKVLGKIDTRLPTQPKQLKEGE